jgi:hypothetical protein
VLKSICVLVLLFAFSLGKQLASNADSLCRNGCSWSDSTIWDNGRVPTSTDSITINNKGSYTITVDSNVNIESLTLGLATSKDDGLQTLEILSGATFTTSSDIKTYLTSSLIVYQNANLVATDSSEVQGELTVYGQARFRGKSPSLKIYTQTIQIPGFVNAQLTLQNGNVAVSNDLEISSQSNLEGSGTIDGNLKLEGDMSPGIDGIGRVAITGDLNMGNAGEIFIDIQNNVTFDTVAITNRANEKGTVYVNLKGDYEPEQGREFEVFTHGSRKGDFGSVRPNKNINNLLSKKWKAVSEQKSTFLHYNSASSFSFTYIFVVIVLIMIVHL